MIEPTPMPLVADPARLQALASTGILDTPAEPGFDDIVHLAGRLCDAPVSLVSLVAEESYAGIWVTEGVRRRGDLGSR